MAFFVMGISSCSSDDEPSIDHYASLYGIWDDEENEPGIEHYWIFNADKTGSQNFDTTILGKKYKSSFPFTYVFDGKTITTTSSDGNNYVNKHPVTITGNRMILDDGTGAKFYLTKRH